MWRLQRAKKNKPANCVRVVCIATLIRDFFLPVIFFCVLASFIRSSITFLFVFFSSLLFSYYDDDDVLLPLALSVSSALIRRGNVTTLERRENCEKTRIKHQEVPKLSALVTHTHTHTEVTEPCLSLFPSPSLLLSSSSSFRLSLPSRFRYSPL